ncbi:hypothetical protein ACFU98_37375 [Streptomyces sp. NPDC057575]|uniref:hypothetical protein n=1 Tax=unclassified Streptomyces TaxID=2593676 RepID=UPI0036854586
MQSEEHAGRFLRERCTVAPAVHAEQTQLYNSYRNWCRLEDTNPISSRAFAARVRATLGIATSKGMTLSNQRKFYPGIGLNRE